MVNQCSATDLLNSVDMRSAQKRLDYREGGVCMIYKRPMEMFFCRRHLKMKTCLALKRQAYKIHACLRNSQLCRYIIETTTV